jgi:hypothetical protein
MKNEVIKCKGKVLAIYSESNGCKKFKFQREGELQTNYVSAYYEKINALNRINPNDYVELIYTSSNNNQAGEYMFFMNAIYKLNPDGSLKYPEQKPLAYVPHENLHQKNIMSSEQIEINNKETRRWNSLSKSEQVNEQMTKWELDTRPKKSIMSGDKIVWKFVGEEDNAYRDYNGDRYHYYSTTDHLYKFK